jgi:hypothetical protein
MPDVTDPASDPRTPGERRLARPPSDRYRSTTTAGADRDDGVAIENGRAGSPARGLAFGTIAALAGAAATVILGGVFAMSAGLLVVAAATGYAVGLAVAAGAGTRGTPGASPQDQVGRWTPPILAVIGVVLGQLGLWLFARTEGGVLSLPDYLGQTFGFVVPLQVLVAGAVAWWTTR